MSRLSQTAAFAAGLYLQRADTWYLAHIRREPVAMLQTRKGRRDPYPVSRIMHRNGPLAPTARGNWSTASHRVCSAVLRDRRFGVMPDDQIDLSFLGMNPPDHTRLRRLAQPSFSPKTLPAYRDRIEKTVGGLLDRASAAGRFDLVSALAAPLPIGVISDLLGIPDDATGEFQQFGAVIGSSLDGVRSLRHASRIAEANARLNALFTNLIALRRREPADDIISRLLAAEGDQLKPGELEPMLFLLLIAGFETTVNVIGNCVLALLSNPEQWEALRADPETMAPKAVEEALRYDPPVQVTSRIAREDLDFEGRQVRRGQVVLTMLGGAGRDPEVYARPDVFDISREPEAEHLAFSAGIHYCVGQPLARMEATIAMRLLAERLPGLRIAGPVRRQPGSTIRGLRQLPVSGAGRG